MAKSMMMMRSQAMMDKLDNEDLDKSIEVDKKSESPSSNNDV